MKFVEMIHGQIINFHLVQKIYFTYKIVNFTGTKKTPYTEYISFMDMPDEKQIQFLEVHRFLHFDEFKDLPPDVEDIEIDEFIMQDILIGCIKYILDTDINVIKNDDLENNVFGSIKRKYLRELEYRIWEINQSPLKS